MKAGPESARRMREAEREEERGRRKERRDKHGALSCLIGDSGVAELQWVRWGEERNEVVGGGVGWGQIRALIEGQVYYEELTFSK